MQGLTRHLTKPLPDGSSSFFFLACNHGNPPTSPSVRLPHPILRCTTPYGLTLGMEREKKPNRMTTSTGFTVFSQGYLERNRQQLVEFVSLKIALSFPNPQIPTTEWNFWINLYDFSVIVLCSTFLQKCIKYSVYCTCIHVLKILWHEPLWVLSQSQYKQINEGNIFVPETNAAL